MNRAKPKIGDVTRTDLTAKPAPQVHDVYAGAVGCLVVEAAMGGYAACGMSRPADGKMVAGVCQARGENASLPPLWLIDLNVAKLKPSLDRGRKLAGKIICPARKRMGGNRAVMRNPAGVGAALYEPVAN